MYAHRFWRILAACIPWFSSPNTKIGFTIKFESYLLRFCNYLMLIILRQFCLLSRSRSSMASPALLTSFVVVISLHLLHPRGRWRQYHRLRMSTGQRLQRLMCIQGAGATLNGNPFNWQRNARQQIRINASTQQISPIVRRNHPMDENEKSINWGESNPIC